MFQTIQINFNLSGHFLRSTCVQALLITALFFGLQPIVEAQTTLSDGPVDVTPEQAAQLLADDTSIVILDVRTPVEFYASHIEGAININYYSFSFKSKLAKLDPNKTYLVHCQTGVRSGKTIPMMVEAGFNSVYHLTNGFKAWKNAGLPTT